MADQRVQRLVFGEAAELYDARRPHWNAELIDDAVAYVQIDALPVTVEIGAGTGRASVLLAPRSTSLTCIEPDSSMAKIALQNLRQFANVEVEVSGFEEWNTDRKFDLLACAQAWHWINLDVRVPKTIELLNSGGAIALFWNAPNWGNHPISPKLDEIYAMNAPTLEAPGWRTSQVEVQMQRARDELEESVALKDIEMRTYGHSETYSTEAYLELLLTHSEHRLLDDETQHRLLRRIGDAIDEELGGQLDLKYDTYLILARKI